MFKFDFDVEEDPEIDELLSQQQSNNQAASTEKQNSDSYPLECRFNEHLVTDLIKSLPNSISFSPLHIPIASGSSLTLSRRDLFDARLQLINEDDGSDPDIELGDLKFVEDPSDIVAGVYEGGLKTWECSIDLATQLNSLCNLKKPYSLRKKRILELGCGTAIPALCFLHEVFAQPPDQNMSVAIHLQDYNELVFRLAVLPNLILTWYNSPASESFRASKTDHEDSFPQVDASQPGDVSLTPALISAFLRSLEEYGIELRLFSGSWESFDLAKAGGKYNIVLSSETIYRLESLPSLLDLMWRACTRPLEELTQDLLTIKPQEASEGTTDYLCVVAAKLVYFGVGGGVAEFVQAVESGVESRCGRNRGITETIWKREEGVKRAVMKVRWK